jgi:hypothetical protein
MTSDGKPPAGISNLLQWQGMFAYMNLRAMQVVTDVARRVSHVIGHTKPDTFSPKGQG